MSKSRTQRANGYYERDTKSTKDWIIEIYSKDSTLKKCKVLAFPKVSAKSNGGYDYNILLEDVLSISQLEKLDDNGIHIVIMRGMLVYRVYSTINLQHTLKMV